MKLRLRGLLFLLCSSALGGAGSNAACTSFGEAVTPDGGEPSADDAGAAPDAQANGCDPATAFEPPVAVSGLATGEHIEVGARLSSDELIAYFGRIEIFEDGGARSAAFTATRTSVTAEFTAFGRMSGPPPVLDGAPSVTADGRTFLFSRTELVTNRSLILKGSLSVRGVGFLDAKKLTGPVNEGKSQYSPYVLPDGSAFYFASERAGVPSRIYRAAPDTAGEYPVVIAVEGLNAPSDARDSDPVVTPDELTLYWTRQDADSSSSDIYVATRPDKGSPFSRPRAVKNLNTSDRHESPTFVSADGCRLYFSSLLVSPYESDILVATKPR